ncbi:MAG: hypothetical protein K6G01_00040 [Eubacterium sp.]|nr:hypothetical protein [Eubacterium sp.]
MSTLYIHLGTPKTGSSAIQLYLADNKEQLQKQNYCFAEFPVKFAETGKYRNGHFLLYLQRPKELKNWQLCVDELKNALDQYDNVILTEEALWGWQRKKNWWNDVKTFLGTLNCDVKFIVYLRAQEDLIESIYNQWVKGFKKSSITFDEFLDEHRYSYLMLHYDEQLKEMAQYFGRENIIARPYDFAQFKNGNIYEDFLDVIGAEVTDEFVVPNHAANPSMPYDALEIKRYINSNAAYVKAKNVNFYSNIIRAGYDTLSSDSKKPFKETRTLFTPERLKEIQKDYEQGNEYVAREYFGREDGVFNTSQKTKETFTPDSQSLLKEGIKVFSGADLYLYEENEKLKKTVKQLTKRLNELEKEVNSVKKSFPIRAWRKVRGHNKEEE